MKPKPTRIYMTRTKNGIGNLMMKDDFETDIIVRQRIVIEELLKAIHGYLNAIGTNRETDKMGDLREIYKQVSSASTMTGTTEE